MTFIYIECPTCGAEGKIDDSLVGSRIKCSKCAQSFTAEVGGSYDLVDPPRRVEEESLPHSSPSSPSGSKPRAKPRAAPKAPDPELEKRLERWAEE